MAPMAAMAMIVRAVANRMVADVPIVVAATTLASVMRLITQVAVAIINVTMLARVALSIE